MWENALTKNKCKAHLGGFSSTYTTKKKDTLHHLHLLACRDFALLPFSSTFVSEEQTSLYFTPPAHLLVPNDWNESWHLHERKQGVIPVRRAGCNPVKKRGIFANILNLLYLNIGHIYIFLYKMSFYSYHISMTADISHSIYFTP